MDIPVQDEQYIITLSAEDGSTTALSVYEDALVYLYDAANLSEPLKKYSLTSRSEHTQLQVESDANGQVRLIIDDEDMATWINKTVVAFWVLNVSNEAHADGLRSSRGQQLIGTIVSHPMQDIE